MDATGDESSAPGTGCMLQMNSRRAMANLILRCRLPFLAIVAASINLGFSQSPQPGVLVVSAADYHKYVAPQSEAAVLGANLADSTASGQVDATGQLITQLAGTAVQVCGESAGLISVSPAQINIVVPPDLKSGICPVVVNADGRMSTGTADIRPVSPAFFTMDGSGSGRAVALNAVTLEPDPFSTLTPENPSADKATRVSLFGTGFRNAATIAPLGANPTSIMRGRITNTSGKSWPVTVEDVGPVAGLAGLDQINIALPSAIDESGVVNFTVTVDSVRSNTVTLNISNVRLPAVGSFARTSDPLASPSSLLRTNTASGSAAGPPQLSAITTLPNPPVAGKAFAFTITGTGFDANTAMVVFNGPGCPGSTCSFTAGSVTVTPTQVKGIAIFEIGTFFVTVTNGPSGPPSNSLTLSVFGSSNGAPQVSTIATLPSTPVTGQVFAYTVTGSGFDPNSATVVFSGPGCINATCSFAGKTLTGTATELTGTAMLEGGVFTVMVKNGSGGALSNGVALSVSGPPIGTPQISTITTSPNPPLAAQPFTFTITGTVDPNTAIVIFNGPGCTASSPCRVTNSALSSKDNAHLSGTETLVGGAFTVTVQNGTSATSNGLAFTVSGPSAGTPQIGTLTTSPNQPLNAQAFTFSITGTDFDPNSAMVSFNGPGCGLASTTCIIANNALLARSSSELDGVAILTGGIFSVSVQNGSSGLTSNSLTLAVSGVTGAPQLSTITTSPNPPLSAQTFTFGIAGTGFDPNSATVIFTGPGCTNSMPCSIANSALASTSSTQLIGTVTLIGGTFTVTVQNGSNGTPSNCLTLTVSGTTAMPQLSAIATAPDPPAASQAFTFTITGTGFDPNNVQLFFNGPGCNASTTCIIANNSLLNKSSTELDGVAILAGGTFNVTVLNAPGSSISNSLILIVAPSASSGTPNLTGITTSPSQPVDGEAFTFTLSGSNFDPNSAMVDFSGPGCTLCTIANSALSIATPTTLSGTAMLAAGSFTVLAQNGSGALSNGLSLTVSSFSAGAIQLAGITTTPNAPIGGQAFTFSITGSGFDPNSALVTFNGPGCAPCTVANIALSSTASTVLSGAAILAAGSFNVTVQNGTTGMSSNGLSLTVANPSGVAPQISALTTTPSQPVDEQTFTFSITGTGFDPTSAVVIFGPNCTPCSIANSELTSATSTQLIGTATLGVGNYTITVQNGPSGAPSNGQALAVASPAVTIPQISGITTSPSFPVNGQTFTFTITGTGYDPAGAVVIFTGPNCAPCSITNASLTTATSTELDGIATLTTGRYIVTVQNGSGPSSNGQQLTVYSVAGAGPQLALRDLALR